MGRPCVLVVEKIEVGVGAEVGCIPSILTSQMDPADPKVKRNKKKDKAKAKEGRPSTKHVRIKTKER
jgi:hypothetical protein